jgi:hypothetical protein
LIYLAAIISDDKLVVGNTSHQDTDALEACIDGLRSEKEIGLPEVDKDVPARSPKATNEPEEDRAAWVYRGRSGRAYGPTRKS